MSAVTSLLTKGAKQADEAADFIAEKSDLLFQAYKEAEASGSKKTKEVVKQLSEKFNDKDIKLIADTFLTHVANLTTTDKAGRKNIRAGFGSAAEATANSLNHTGLITPFEGMDFSPIVTKSDIKALKELDNVRSGEGGSKGVDNLLDEVRQYFRLETRPQSLSSEYMGALAPQRRGVKLETAKKVTPPVLGVGLLGGSGLTLTVQSLLSKDGEVTAKQEKIIEEYETLSDDPVNVTNIEKGSIDKAFSLATKNPSKYIFVENDKPMIMYKGEKIAANLATNEKGTEIMLVPVQTEGKVGGGTIVKSLLTAADEGIEAVKETVEEAVKLAPKVVKFLKEEFKDNFDPEELALQTREAKKQGRRTPVDDFNKSIDYINNSKNSNEAKSRLQEMFEFNIGDVDEFIEEEGGINQVFKQVKSKKALGGSMLSREGYKDGGKTDVEKFISFENQIEEALNKATTPEERETIQRNGQQILDSFSNETKTEAYKQRAREAGISEEEINTPLFSHGGRMTKQEGSLMVAPEREGYSVAGKVIEVVTSILKKAGESGERVKEFLSESQDEIEDFVVNTLKDKRSIIEIIEEDGVKGVRKIDDALLFDHFSKKERAEIEKYGATKTQMRAEQEALDQEVADTVREMESPNLTREERARLLEDEGRDEFGRIKDPRNPPLKFKEGSHPKYPYAEVDREPKQEGSLMVPPEMEQDMPVDTYPNIPPEEMAEAEASQLPDAEMEDKYIDFVMDESLEEEEQSYLMNALEADPKLSQIFDKVMTTASEFTGSGEVEGPGTGVSDSIPARLSDGEFVFTKKATDEMGADNLQQMMDDAERAYDGGVMRRSAQEGGLLMYKQKDEDPLAYEKIAQDEIKKNMLRSNRAPSLNPGQI